MTNETDLTLHDILQRKAAGRRDLAKLSFAQKVRIVEAMRERLAPFNAMRMKRSAETTRTMGTNAAANPSRGR